MEVKEYKTYRVKAYGYSAADNRKKMMYSEPIIAENRDDALAGAKARLHRQGNSADISYTFRVNRVNDRIVLVVVD